MFNRVILIALTFLAALPAKAAETDFSAVAAAIVAQGDALVQDYRPEAGQATSDGFSDLYFDVFEGRGLEGAVGRRDADRKAALESLFSRIIGQSAKGAPADAVAAAWQDLRRGMEEEWAHYSGAAAGAGWWPAFVQAFLILLREGVEALLVVGALIAYVQRTGARGTLPALYVGIVAALMASGLTAWAVRASVLGLSGREMEAVEGVTMLIAAGVLLYVGNWLFSKRDAERWQAYIKTQVDKAVASGSGFAMGAAAFLAVYREGAETVLFYQALLAEQPDAGSGVVAGFGGAALALVALFYAMKALGLRLPLKLFFTATAGLLMALAFIFVGKGIVELQVIRWVSATPVDGMGPLSWLGVFPTVESLAGQAVFLALVAGTLAVPVLRRAKAGA